ncbi:MAG: hypothetical protein IPO82_03565 [Betaproteobacteria bacterium]|nr:hypothetical protein [Betaproteobacteria bacterium]
MFPRAALEREFAAAGFASLRVAAEPYLPFGIVWPEPWSLPMVGAPDPVRLTPPGPAPRDHR